MQSDFVPVAKSFKAHVIGKKGCVIENIRERSGAQIWSKSIEEEGFTVSGNEEQIACAKRLILEKVEEVRRGIWELVEIPVEYKGIIIGKGGANLREISLQTGAEISRRKGEVYITSGTEHQRKQAKVNIGIKLASARLRGVDSEFSKVCCFIDGWNLPESFGLQLEQVLEDDRMVLLGAHKQYRLKSSEGFKSQELPVSSYNNPTYLEELARAAMESLRMLKREREANESLEADMWCHFGAGIIRGASEEEASKTEWSINEATGKFQQSAEKDHWRVAFHEGVDFVEDIFKGNFEQASEENTEYVARYDLTYLAPGGYQLRCKVWVAKEDVKRKLEEIPIPFSDVKNILEDIHFTDELTRSRCRGWLVFPSRRYLQADILFPGCEFDCRLTIRGRTGSSEAIDYVPKEDVRQRLSQYLSGLTLTKDDPFELRLPENEIPEGFHLIHKRSSRRTVYTTKPGFSIILSKECSWRSVVREERSRESVKHLELRLRHWLQNVTKPANLSNDDCVSENKT